MTRLTPWIITWLLGTAAATATTAYLASVGHLPSGVALRSLPWTALYLGLCILPVSAWRSSRRTSPRDRERNLLYYGGFAIVSSLLAAIGFCCYYFVYPAILLWNFSLG